MSTSDRVTGGHGPVVIRRRLGATLKQLRGERGLHLQAVARLLEVSPSKLSRLETGQVEPRIRDVRDLLEIYQAPADLRERALRWAEEAKLPGWWQPFSVAIPDDLDLYISLETEAARIKMFSIPISGLLQTQGYARMLLTGAAPHCSPAELDRLVEVRIGRQAVVDPKRAGVPPVQLHVVLDEAGLHRSLPGPVLDEQLEELIVRSQWPNVTLQVLPFTAGYGVASSTFAIFEPRDPRDATVANVESTGQDAYFDGAGDVARFEQMWSDITEQALPTDESLDLIRALRDHRAS